MGAVFSREYPWSPSCKELNAYAWVDAQIKTGEYETVKEIIEVPDISLIEALFCKYGGLIEDKEQKEDEFAEDGERTLKFQRFSSKRKSENEKLRKKLVKYFMQQQICCGKQNTMQQKRMQFPKACRVLNSSK